MGFFDKVIREGGFSSTLYITNSGFFGIRGVCGFYIHSFDFESLYYLIRYWSYTNRYHQL